MLPVGPEPRFLVPLVPIKSFTYTFKALAQLSHWSGRSATGLRSQWALAWFGESKSVGKLVLRARPPWFSEQ